MKLILFSTVFFILSTPLCIAGEWMGWGDENIKRLSLFLEKMTYNQNAQEEQTVFAEAFMDLQNRRFLGKVYHQNPQKHSTNPSTVVRIKNRQQTTIDYTKRRVKKEVFISSRPNLPSAFSIFRESQYYLNDAYADMIKHASRENQIEKKNGRLMFTLKEPMSRFVTAYPSINTYYPVTIWLNKNYKPIKVNDFITIEWSKNQEYNFPYPQKLINTFAKKQGKPIVHTSLVRHIELNPTWPDGMFQVTIPSDFSEKDASGLLKSPLDF